MGVLEIERKNVAYTDNLRKYKLVIDGEQCGTIGRGETVTQQLEPGRHSVKLTINWCSSEKLTVDIAGDETVKLWCRPRANPLTVLWFITLGSTRYIRLGYAGPDRSARG